MTLQKLPPSLSSMPWQRHSIVLSHHLRESHLVCCQSDDGYIRLDTWWWVSMSVVTCRVSRALPLPGPRLSPPSSLMYPPPTSPVRQVSRCRCPRRLIRLSLPPDELLVLSVSPAFLLLHVVACHRIDHFLSTQKCAVRWLSTAV